LIFENLIALKMNALRK